MKPNVNDILTAVSTVFGVAARDILGPYTFKEYARPRQVVMFLAREMTGFSYPQIGRALNRDHTTAMWGVKATVARMAHDSTLAPKIEACRIYAVGIKNQREKNFRAALKMPLVEKRAA